VLLWTVLLTSSLWTLTVGLYSPLFQGLKYLKMESHLFLVPAVPFAIFAPLSGWLADVKYGNYKVFKAGCMVMFISSVLACVCVLIQENIEEDSVLSKAISVGIVPVVYAFGLLGVMASFAQTLQLGLDQMPEGSADNFTSFIVWFGCLTFLGFWISNTLFTVSFSCAENWSINQGYEYQVLSITPVLSMGVICSSMFLLAPKWLKQEPQSPQSLKIITRVIKFAAKHKSPVYRSALTYWEENIPSRLDLGKSKYGGPFTTEQVENVKTFLKILLMPLPYLVLILATNIILPVYNVYFVEQQNCTSAWVYIFTYNPWWLIALSTVIFEGLVYPLVGHKLPNTLKRMGCVKALLLAINIGFLLTNVYLLYFPSKTEVTKTFIASCILYGPLSMVLTTSMYEFVCAQAPYNMRGLLTGYTIFLNTTGLVLGFVIFEIMASFCDNKYMYCSIIKFSLSSFLSLIGFIAHCVLSIRYKRRVRDEEYCAHTVVEDVYDRYLSAEEKSN